MQTSTLPERVALKNMCYVCKSPEHNFQASLPSKSPKYIYVYIYIHIYTHQYCTIASGMPFIHLGPSCVQLLESTG